MRLISNAFGVPASADSRHAKETAHAPPPLLLPEDTEGNPPGFGCDEANLFLVVVNHEIVVDDRAVGSGTHERAGAVCIHSIGVCTEYSLRDLAV
jgi:hypothetical protein